MPNWNGTLLTAKGRALQAKVEAGATMTITKLKIGDGTMGGGQTVDALTDLLAPKKNLVISALTPLESGVCKITAVVTNSGLTAGFYVRELGVFAQDPDLGEILYAYTADGSPDYLPAEGGTVAVAEELVVQLAFSNAANIKATINLDGLITTAILNAHKNAAVIDHPDGSVTDAKIGNRTITDTVTAADGADTPTRLWSKLGNMVKQITGKANWWIPPAVTLEAINALITSTAAAGKLLKLDSNGKLPADITGTAATATKLQISRTISLTGDVTGNANFDGSGNISIAATVTAGMPLGFTFSILADTPPDGCLALQGAPVSRTVYPELWTWVQAYAPLITEEEWQAQAAVQSSVGFYSSGDGSTTFRLPLITDFVRGTDAGRSVGTWQEDMFKLHKHEGSDQKGNVQGGSGEYVYNGINGGASPSGSNAVVPEGGIETRPKSVAMLWCVKAFGAAVNQGTVDITALVNEMASKANRSEVQQISILTGTVAHGGTIPLPAGYMQEQCKWTVGSNYVNAPGGQGSDVYVCRTNANRVVEVWGFIGDKWTEYGIANYMIIGVK